MRGSSRAEPASEALQGLSLLPWPPRTAVCGSPLPPNLLYVVRSCSRHAIKLPAFSSSFLPKGEPDFIATRPSMAPAARRNKGDSQHRPPHHGQTTTCRGLDMDGRRRRATIADDEVIGARLPERPAKYVRGLRSHPRGLVLFLTVVQPRRSTNLWSRECRAASRTAWARSSPPPKPARRQLDGSRPSLTSGGRRMPLMSRRGGKRWQQEKLRQPC